MTERVPLFVTRPTLPPLAEMVPLLEQIWQSRTLTNYGPIHCRLEDALCRHLGVEHISLVANATLGLILSLACLGRGEEIITTPFSFVATCHSIWWARCKAVFADVDPVTLNIDPAAVERQITPRTRAILAVHCFGVPCDVAALRAIADRHGLALIYDAAHAFGVRKDGRSILEHGDLSILSFHATKVFNTIEGGAVIARDRETKNRIDRLCNFGIQDEATIPDIGMNAKLSELHAAAGLALLPHVDAAIEARGRVSRRYWTGLQGVPGIRCLCAPDLPGHNHHAFPIIVEDAYPIDRDELYTRLRAHDIFARRYFHPLIADLPTYRDLPSSQPDQLPVARDAARRVLCLPMYPDLDADNQQRVIDLIRSQ